MTLVRRHRTLLPLAALLLLVGVAALSARHAAGPAPAQSPPATRLLPFSYFGLDEAAGDALDDSAGNHAGAAVRATPTPGKLGRARLLSAASQSYLDLGDIPQIGGATKLTVSAWVNLSAAQGQQGFVTKWGDAGNTLWTDFQNGTPRAAFAVGAFIAAKNFALPAGGWHHVVWSYDGTAAANAARLKLYVDGAARELEFGSHTVPPALASNATPVVVGSFKGQMLFLNGAVDEVGFWAEAAGAGLVANLYNANPNGGGAGRAVTYADIARADRLHRDSVVLLAHTHDFKRYTTNAGVLVDDFANAKAGGVTAMTAKLTTDGVDWDRPARLRCYIPPDPPDQTTAGRPCPAVPYRERFLGHLDELTAAQLADVTLGLVRLGYSDEEVSKVLGRNLLDLYRRAWRPFKGRPDLRTCTNAESDPALTNLNRVCASAAANTGEGGMNQRPVNCRSAAAPGVIGLQISYLNGKWVFYSNDNTGARDCEDGSTLVASWPEPAGNARFEICTHGDADPVCAAAAADGGRGTASARAINCRGQQGGGVVGLQLAYSGGQWRYTDNLNPSLTHPCAAESVLVAEWGAASTPAQFRLCDNTLDDPVCQSAASGGGSGTDNVRAVNCANSTSFRGQLGLKLEYVSGRWMYRDNVDTLKPCVEGSVLVAERAAP